MLSGNLAPAISPLPLAISVEAEQNQVECVLIHQFCVAAVITDKTV